MGDRADADPLADALRLRRWALRRLAGASTPAPKSALDVWRSLLATERCGLPLARVLNNKPDSALAASHRAALDERARTETQRVLAARGQLHAIGMIAAKLGTTIVPLKGAVAALNDHASLDLADLDVLCPPGDARRLASALDASGYESAGFSSDQHLRQRVADGALHVEIHVTAEETGTPLPDAVWSRTTQIEGDGLCTLAPIDHLWYTLTHLVGQHPFRQGSLRDLLLISTAAEGCSEGDLAEVRARIECHPLAVGLRSVLETARRLSAGDHSADPFERVAGVLYHMRLRAGRLPIPPALGTEVGLWVYALLFEGRSRSIRHRIAMASLDHSASPAMASLETRLPPAGRLVRRVVRSIRFAVAFLVAVPVALAASRAVTRAMKRVAAG